MPFSNATKNDLEGSPIIQKPATYFAKKTSCLVSVTDLLGIFKALQSNQENSHNHCDVSILRHIQNSVKHLRCSRCEYS